MEQLKEKLQGITTSTALKPVGLEIFRQLETQFAELENVDQKNKGMVYNVIKNNTMDFAIMVQLSHLMIATGVNEGQAYSQLAGAIGARICNFYNIKVKETIDIRLGAFVLNAYAILDLVLIKMINRAQGHRVQTVYYAYAGNKGKLQKLKKEFDETSDPYRPLSQQAPDWEYGTVKNALGEDIKIIKDASIDTLSRINSNNTPIVLNAINKKQKIGYYVKPEIFEVYKWALKTNQECFEHNSVATIEFTRKAAKKAEANAILEATEPYVGKVFYQQYNADSRGRLYPLSAYLNELNSDNAKGMLSFAIGKPLGTTGLNQLKHHISNMWGEDKKTHEGRVEVVDDNYNSFVSYGRDPYNNKGWMEAAEPFQFLNAVMELAQIDSFEGNVEDFISTTICYRDGSNNGLQWLFGLAKDDQHGHLVNIKPTPNKKPGDMYTHVAEAVIVQIAERVSEEAALAFENYDLYFKAIEALRNRCRVVENKLGNKHPLSERKRKVVKWYQRRYKEQLKTTDLLYWNKAKDNGFDTKTWRKVVKRNVMTYGYSATKQGMGEQIIQDTRDIENEYLANKQHSAARLLGSMVYNTIETEFPLVSAAMKLFKDNCGLYMKKTGKQYFHNTMISNFPFAQHYFKKVKRKIDIQGVYVTEADYKTKSFKDIRINGEFNSSIPDVAKSKAGISPNTIHNLDSLHLMLVINECNFDIVSAHDSYGSHAGDVVEMQKVIREQFKRVIDSNPIENILLQTGNLTPMIETGNLDSAEILNSEFAFS